MNPSDIAIDTSNEGLDAVPGIAVGVLLVIAAILWFSPGAQHRFRKATLWLVIIAIAMIIIFDYIELGQSRGGA